MKLSTKSFHKELYKKLIKTDGKVTIMLVAIKTNKKTREKYVTECLEIEYKRGLKIRGKKTIS